MRNIDLQDISDMQEIKNEYDCIPVLLRYRGRKILHGLQHPLL